MSPPKDNFGERSDNEIRKITGINPLWILALLTATFLLVCGTGGNTVNWGYLGFEVLFPFYAAIVISEWCKTRTDPMFEVISAQGKSLLGWIVRRFVLLSGVVFIFAFAGIIGVVIIKGENSIPDLLFTFLPTALPTAFFLSSTSEFISLLGNVPHIPTMTVGVLWLVSIMCMSLLRFAPMQYFYLFVRYAGISGPLWIANKAILLFIGIILWFGIALFCKKHTWG